MDFLNINWDSVMKNKIARKDIKGVALVAGDIVAESTIGKSIWNDMGIVVKRPFGIVTIYHRPDSSEHFRAEEADCYNVMPIRKGAVELNNTASDWMKNIATVDKESGKMYMDLNISCYDGSFYAWDTIEKIYNVEDFVQ